MILTPRTSLLLFGALSCASSAAFADVIVVPPPSDEQNVIDQAIQAAAPGDTIQLLEGVYGLAPFESILIDKPIRLLGAGPSLTTIKATDSFASLFGTADLEVADIAAGQQVLIQGIGFEFANSNFKPEAILVRDSEGVVGLLDCTITTVSLDSPRFLRVQRCAAFFAQNVECINPSAWSFADSNAQLEGCTLEGGPGVELPPIYGLAQAGLRADRSSLSISASDLTGGSGGAVGVTGTTSATDGLGQPAIVLQSSTLTLFGGSNVTGGDAGTTFGTGARGGAGLAADAFSRVRIDASTAVEGGLGASGVVPAIQAAGGALVVEEARRAIHLSSADPVVVSPGFADVLVAGEPGTPFAAYLALAPPTLPVALAGIDGLVGLDLALAFELFTGIDLALDDAGQTLLQVTAITTGQQTSVELTLQAVEFIPDGTARASNALLTLFVPL